MHSGKLGPMFTMALAASAISAPCPATAATPSTPVSEIAPKQLPALKIILIGDSTTAVLSGWGGAFCSRHVTMWTSCVNMARNGRSSAGYIREGSWALAQAEMRAPAYQKVLVLIQFGHNDQPGHPGQETNLNTEFPVNIERYVRETRAAGAIPVLVTPLSRRRFVNGKHENTLVPWSDEIREIAKRMDVPLVDLNAESAAIVSALGPTLANGLAMGSPSRETSAAALDRLPYPDTAGKCDCADDRAVPARPKHPQLGEAGHYFDITHLGAEGAEFFATLIARDLAREMPDLRPWLVLED